MCLNHNIYYGLNTYSHRNPVTFHPQITKKSTLEPVLQLCYPKSRKNHKSDPKVGPKRVPISTQNRSKSRSGPQGVLWGIPRYPWITQMVPQDAKRGSKIKGDGCQSICMYSLGAHPNSTFSMLVQALYSSSGHDFLMDL